MKKPKYIFKFSERIIFNDLNIEECIPQLLNNNKLGFYFDFKDISVSLKKIKQYILENKSKIDFSKKYFFNIHEVVNDVLGFPYYLPKNINIFLSEKCIIGCAFCDKNLDKAGKKGFLSLLQIQCFFEKYPLGDDINYNIIGRGDPLFNPEIDKIIIYLKSIGGYNTLFSGGKALLLKDMKSLDGYIDEYKINLSASCLKIYNKTHTNSISEKEFQKLLEIISSIHNKTYLITVLLPENILDLKCFYKLCLDLQVRGIEIKKNLRFQQNDIITNRKINRYVYNIINKILGENKIDLIQNIFDKMVKVINPSIKDISQNTLVHGIVGKKSKEVTKGCYQFGRSLDLNEDGSVTICCRHSVGKVGYIDSEIPYYQNQLFKIKENMFQGETPSVCKTCPLTFERQENYRLDLAIRNL